MKYYTLATGSRKLENAEGFEWPYEISICFDDSKRAIGFGQGVAHGSGWCAVNVMEGLSESWVHHFEITNAGWLRTLLRTHEHDLQANRDRFLAEYKRLHNQDPEEFNVGC